MQKRFIFLILKGKCYFLTIKSHLLNQIGNLRNWMKVEKTLKSGSTNNFLSSNLRPAKYVLIQINFTNPTLQKLCLLAQVKHGKHSQKSK